MLALVTLALAHGAAPDLSIGVREDTYPSGSVETAVRAVGPQLLACFPDVATPPVAAAVDIGKDGAVTAATVPVVSGATQEVGALGVLRQLHLPERSASTTLVLLLQPIAAAGTTPALRFQAMGTLGSEVSQLLATDGEGIGGLIGVRGMVSGSLDASVVNDALGTVTLAAPVIRGA